MIFHPTFTDPLGSGAEARKKEEERLSPIHRQISMVKLPLTISHDE